MAEQQIGPLLEQAEVGPFPEVPPGRPIAEGREVRDDQHRVYFDCAKCPAFCCSVYERVQVTKRDLNRLARYFGLTPEQAERRYTRKWDGERVLKRVEDTIFEKTCTFLDQEKRLFPLLPRASTRLRTFPGRSRCAYYDLLQFERR